MKANCASSASNSNSLAESKASRDSVSEGEAVATVRAEQLYMEGCLTAATDKKTGKVDTLRLLHSYFGC